MNILLTGAAGFIGSAVMKALCSRGHNVAGIDNINDYYSPRLKTDRLRNLGFAEARPDIPVGTELKSSTLPEATFIRTDITDAKAIAELMAALRPDKVVHLAAQAGVRYSLENPGAYIATNITGFFNIADACRLNHTGHLIYASSSSVYGANSKIPYTESDPTEQPVSLYAATKKSDELIARAYAATFGLRTTGLRFFTVYGPWGRPDMAPMIFMKAITQGMPLRLFNAGRMKRDFTYIDDVARAVVAITEAPAPAAPAIYNVGRSQPVELPAFLNAIERYAGKKAIVEEAPMQKGDVAATWADCSALQKDFGFSPRVSLDEGLRAFHQWYEIYSSSNPDI